jgi:hypothetical protein
LCSANEVAPTSTVARILWSHSDLIYGGHRWYHDSVHQVPHLYHGSTPM